MSGVVRVPRVPCALRVAPHYLERVPASRLPLSLGCRVGTCGMIWRMLSEIRGTPGRRSSVGPTIIPISL